MTATRLRALRAAFLESPEASAAIAIPSDGAEALFYQGLIRAYREQDFEAAIAAFVEARAAFESPSEQGACLIEEAHIHSLLGRADPAAACLNEALSTFPETARELRGEASYHLARLLARRERFAEALEHHLASRPYYQARPELGRADHLGFECWVRERLEDYEGWSATVRELVDVDPDKLALHRIPPNNVQTLQRCEALVAGLDGLIKSGDRADLEWLRALRAMAFYISRQPERALEALGLAVRPSAEAPVAPPPGGPFAAHLAGKCALRLEQHDRALVYLEAAASEAKDYFDLVLDLAMVSENLGRYERALDYYQRLRDLDPLQVLPLARLALLKERLNRKNEAVDAYREVSERDPRNREALVRLALLNAELKRDEDALSWLNRALKATGPDPTLLVARARVSLRLEQPKLALKDARKAINLLEPLVVDRGARALVSEPGVFGPLPEDLRTRGASSPAEAATKLLARARLVQAQVDAAMGRTETAAELVDQVLVELPANEEAMLLKGDCARALGSPSAAVDSYKDLIDTILCEQLLKDGLALAFEGRHREALGKYKAAYAHFPKHWAVFYNTALAYAQLGEISAATKYLAIAFKFNKNAPSMVEAEDAFTALRASPQYAALRDARS